MFKRVIVIVLDNVGMDALPDMASYEDFSINTIANLARSKRGFYLSTLEQMG
jgi:phosphopentomutase